MTFQDILVKYRAVSFSERDKGDRFERLMQAFLQTVPWYAGTFRHVWLWREFPYKQNLGGKDTGIDLVAQTVEGDFWAIQCKCYAETASIDKPAVDSFLATSSKQFVNDQQQTTSFALRLWISTTNKWGSEAENAIRHQEPPVQRISLADLESAPVDWAALEQGVSLNWIMDGLKQRAGNFKAGIVLMGYLNPFLQYGLERFAADAAQAGVSGCIVPDLPLDESAPVRTTLKVHGIDLIALVGQNTSEERMREYAAVSEGYVYVVSVLGTTGARTGLPPQVEATLRRARKAFNLPLALGFGLQHPDQLAAIPADIRPDAAVFGSALLKHLDKGNTAKAFLEVWTR